MRIVVEIEATNWTKENIFAFHDWLVDEMNMGNMATGDDARVVSVKVVAGDGVTLPTIKQQKPTNKNK